MRGKHSAWELATVLLIIAGTVLAIMPVIGVTDQEKTAKCAANGRKVVAALLMYMADWDGRFPRALSTEERDALPALGPYDWPGTPNIVESMWPAGIAEYRLVQLRPYVKNQSIFICTNPTNLYVQRYAFGYRCSWLFRASDNFINGDTGFVNSDGSGRTIAEVEVLETGRRPPHRKIIAFCYGIGDWGTGAIGGPDWVEGIFPACPHDNGSVYAYADGHVKWRKMGHGWAPVGYTGLWIDQDPGP